MRSEATGGDVADGARRLGDKLQYRRLFAEHIGRRDALKVALIPIILHGLRALVEQRLRKRNSQRMVGRQVERNEFLPSAITEELLEIIVAQGPRYDGWGGRFLGDDDGELVGGEGRDGQQASQQERNDTLAPAAEHDQNRTLSEPSQPSGAIRSLPLPLRNSSLNATAT